MSRLTCLLLLGLLAGCGKSNTGVAKVADANAASAEEARFERLVAGKLDDGDRLIDVRIVSPGEDVVLATRKGMAIRFTEDDAREQHGKREESVLEAEEAAPRPDPAGRADIGSAGAWRERPDVVSPA